jgi:hypothetical protein
VLASPELAAPQFPNFPGGLKPLPAPPLPGGPPPAGIQILPAAPGGVVQIQGGVIQVAPAVPAPPALPAVPPPAEKPKPPEM